MPRLRKEYTGTCKFYARGITLYPEQELYREMGFISYYFHWSQDDVTALPHNERRRWCQEISAINANLNPSEKKEKSILEFGRRR